MSKTSSLVSAIFQKLCPKCREGKIYRGPFQMNLKCPACGYDFYPEPGFYLGAMMVPFFFTAMTTVPFAIYLKMSGLEVSELLQGLGVYYFVVSSTLLWFSKSVWLHLEYRMTRRLKERD